MFLIRFVFRRLFRFALTLALIPLAGIAAVKLADRLEQTSGPTTTSRLLRRAGGMASRRRPAT